MIKSIIVFGVGAAGSNLLQNLVCVHPELSYTAVDFDKVELRNVDPGTQPYSKSDINRPKVQAIQRILLMQRNKRIEAINQRIEKARQITDLAKTTETIVVDAFDNAISRNLFEELKTISPKLPVLHIGFSARMTGEVVWGESFTKMDSEPGDANIDVCEMYLARPFINALAAIGSIICSDYISRGVKTNAYFDRTLKLMTF